MPRYRISTLLLLCVVVAISLAWFADHQRLKFKINQLNRPMWVNAFAEKHNYWSPSAHLRIDDIAILENRLASHGFVALGEIVSSSQGAVDSKIRRPTFETLDALVDLLYKDDTKVDAANLLALYLQALSGRDGLFDEKCLATKAYFQLKYAKGIRWSLLKDPNDEVRCAAALVLGNTLPDLGTIESLQHAFDQERNDTVKARIAWAVKTLKEPH